MNRTFRAAGVAIVAITCASGFAARADGHKRGKNHIANKEASALFIRAKALADMMAPSTPPYALRIRVTGVGQLSGYPDGIYSLQFASPSEFRRDAAFGTAHFSSGAHGDPQNQWQIKDASPHSLLEEVFLRSMSYAYAPTAIALSDVNATVKHRSEHGANLECVKQQSPLSKEACFDSLSGALRAVLDDPGFVYQYGEFVLWGGHLAPEKILVFANNALIVRAQVEFLVALTKKEAQFVNFAPPADAVKPQPQESCGLEQARLISAAIPSFPRGAGSPRGGSVLFWGEIDESGQIEDAIVMQSAGAAYDQAALQAMRQWRYAPAKKCGEPVATPGAFRISFR